MTVTRPPANPKRRRKEKQKHFCEFANEWSEQQKPMFSWWHLAEIKWLRFWRKWNLNSPATRRISWDGGFLRNWMSANEMRQRYCCKLCQSMQSAAELWFMNLFVNTLISHCPLTTVNMRKDENSIVIRECKISAPIPRDRKFSWKSPIVSNSSLTMRFRKKNLFLCFACTAADLSRQAKTPETDKVIRRKKWNLSNSRDGAQMRRDEKPRRRPQFVMN